VRALARRALARRAQTRRALAQRGTARTRGAGRARGCTSTHALADAQVVAREADLQGAHAGNDRKKSTVVVSPAAERKRNDSGKVYLEFTITVGGTAKKFTTNCRPLGEPLASDRQLVAEFLGWFFARDLPKDRNWLAVAIAEWTRLKFARMEEEPAPIRDKYAARSHPRALVRVPGGAAPRSCSRWSQESGS
jgi:hypothetical protein